MGHHVSFGVRDGYSPGDTCGANIIAAVLGADGSASRGQFDVFADVLAANGTGDGRRLYRAAQVANGLRSRNARGIDRRITGDFNGVGNGNMAQARGFFADAQGVAFEFDWRVGNDVVQAVLRIAKSKSGDAHISVYVHLAVSTSDDGNVPGDIAQFKTYRAGNIQRAVEAAGNRGAHLAACERHDQSEQRDGG